LDDNRSVAFDFRYVLTRMGTIYQSWKALKLGSFPSELSGDIIVVTRFANRLLVRSA